MSMTYAIPDVHGRLDLLTSAFEKIARNAAGVGATIVTLGDYVDRGPKSRDVIEFLMAWRSDTLRLVCLKGNHEAMMWEACNGLCELDWWLVNGGSATLISYGLTAHDEADTNVVPEGHLAWIAALPKMHVDEHRVFVHAGVDPDLPLREQNEQILLWKRYPQGADLGHGSRHVVHGHHGDPRAPRAGKCKTNLDGLAWRTGRLVIGVFDDDQPGGASEYLEVVGKPG